MLASTFLIRTADALIEDSSVMLDETLTLFCNTQATVDSLVADAITDRTLSTSQDTLVADVITDEASLTTTALTAIELVDAKSDAVLTILITTHSTEETLSIFADASSIPPPASVENGDCENALIPNIISNAHYLITMQK
jgi:hypothetical protein